MKRGRDAPRAQRMKEHGSGISRFVGMELVEEIVARVCGIEQFSEFSAKRFDLLIVEQTYAGEISMSVKEFNLFVAEAILIPVAASVCRSEEIGDRAMITGEIFVHANCGFAARCAERLCLSVIRFHFSE